MLNVICRDFGINKSDLRFRDCLPYDDLLNISLKEVWRCVYKQCFIICFPTDSIIVVFYQNL